MVNKSRDSSQESPPRPSPAAASQSLALNGHPKQQYPSTTGRKVSFMYGASVDIDSAHPKATTGVSFTPRAATTGTTSNNRTEDTVTRQGRKKSPPKWARGKKEWNPERLMDFWSQAIIPKCGQLATVEGTRRSIQEKSGCMVPCLATLLFMAICSSGSSPLLSSPPFSYLYLLL